MIFLPAAANGSAGARCFFLIPVLLLGLRAATLDGAIDPSFKAPLLAPIPNPVVVQTDGRSIAIVGSAGGTAGLVRLNTNGQSDPGFSTGLGPLIITPPIDIPSAGIHLPGATNPGSIATVALQSGGQVIVGGNFTYFDSTTVPRNVLVRLTPNGTVDTTFSAGNGLTGGSGGMIPASGEIPASAGSWFLGSDLGVKTVLTLERFFANGTAAKVALLPDCSYELYADGLGTSQGGTFKVGPAISFPPVSVNFDSGAIGTAPFTYQWRHNGTALQGANGPQLQIPNVRRADLGQYTLVVTGPGGTVESQPATLAEAALISQPVLTFRVVGGTTLHLVIPVGFRLEQSASLEAPVLSHLSTAGTVDVPIVVSVAFFRLVPI